MATTSVSTRTYRLLMAGGWCLWASVHGWMLWLFGWPLPAAMADSLLSNALLALAGLAIATSLRFYLPTANRLVYLSGLTAFMWLFWFVVCKSALLLLPYQAADYQQFWTQSTPLRMVAGLLLLASYTLIHVLWYSLRQQHEEEERRHEMERLAREAELYHLREQLHPHFLFNSLNSINALIGSRPEQARHMTQQLADFLRGTLRKEHQQRISLQEELRHLELYLAIEKVRFGHRLQTQVSCTDEAAAALLPAMLLQPVVENAIKFGLYDTTGDICIRIDAAIEGHRLQIKVSNPYDAATAAQNKGTGFGLKSIERRLYLLFAQSGLLQTSADGQTFTTTIFIPQFA